MGGAAVVYRLVRFFCIKLIDFEIVDQLVVPIDAHNHCFTTPVFGLDDAFFLQTLLEECSCLLPRRLFEIVLRKFLWEVWIYMARDKGRRR